MAVRENSFVEACKYLRENNSRLAEEKEKLIRESLEASAKFNDRRLSIIEARELKARNHSRLLEACRNDALGKAIKAIYITALEANSLTDNGIILAENMVDTWIKENGGARTILNRVKDKTYFLNRLNAIVEDAAEDEVKEIEDLDKGKTPEDKEEKKEDSSTENPSEEDIKNAAKTIADKLDIKNDEEAKKALEILNTASGNTEDPVEEKEAEEDSKDTDEKDEDNKDEPKSDEDDSLDDDDMLDAASGNTKEESTEDDKKSDEETSNEEETEDSKEDDTVEKEPTQAVDTEPEKQEDASAEEIDDDEIMDAASGNTKEEEPTSEDPSESEDAKDVELPDDATTDADDSESDIADDLTDEVDHPEEDVTIDGDAESHGKVFDELEKETDVKKAVELISQRVADAEENFIKRNAEDKKAINNLIGRISDNVKTVEDIADEEDPNSKVAAESARLYRQKISQITENRILSVYEKMSRNLYSNIAKDSVIRESYLEESGKIDTALVMESAKVMYGFLETINTLQLEKVNTKYIQNILESM